MVAERLPAAFRADSPENLSDITFLGFNQDQSCFAVGTGKGFTIFDTNTCVQLHHEECGAVSYVEMLFNTSLVALVGHSTRCASSSSKRLTLWNTKERSEICHLCFDALIYSVKMNHRRLAVLLREEVHILDLRSMKRLHVIERAASPWLDPAVGSLCTAQDRGYLALPLTLAPVSMQENLQTPNFAVHSSALTQGAGKLEVRVGLVSIVDTHTLQPVGTLLAHRSPVQALCLNMTGHLLATASTKASVVRVFSVPALEILYVFRRGANPCRVFGLNFSSDSEYLCLAASSGTVHVFRNSEQVLGTLPPPPDPSTVSVNNLRGRSVASPKLRPIPLGPDRGPKVDDSLDKADDSEANNVDDLSEWNVVAERPERQLELLSSGWSVGNGRESGLKREALDVLEALSGASGNVTKHARSILQMLPQSCRELVDAERAYATVHLREEEDPHSNSSSISEIKPSPSKALLADGMSSSLLSAASLSASGLSAVLSALPVGSQNQVVHGGYVACANPRPCRVGGSRLEMVVATRRGGAYIYDWDLSTGGEGQLRVEHSIAPDGIEEWSLDELPQTPPAHRRSLNTTVTPPPEFFLPEAAAEGSTLLEKGSEFLDEAACGTNACDLRTVVAVGA